jgi:hypothetical protein
VESLGIVKNKVGADPLPCIPYGLVVVDIDVLILQRAPESLDEDIVEGPSSAVHADGNGFIDEQYGKQIHCVLVPSNAYTDQVYFRKSRFDDHGHLSIAS